MIISKTPYRISFFGGGTDYPAYFREHGGAVIGTAIDKFCYLTCRDLPPFFDHTSRIVYSEQECVTDHTQIRHPTIRAALELMEIDHGVEIHHDGDLPARSGLGSSSSCTVGILNALYAMQGRRATKMELANWAVHIEQNMLRENVGSQDQVFAAFGGFNKVLFRPDGQIDVNPVMVRPKRKEELQEKLMFCFTRTTRYATNVAKSVIENIARKQQELREMYQMVGIAEEIVYGGDLDDFGRLLHESWMLKRSISTAVSNDYLDGIYARARDAGAIGGKLVGAGGGGFMLFYVPLEHQAQVKKALGELVWVPIRFESEGSKIIYFSE
jgi:D-glycero-alpha-D-manno-heptose-7-phosphate kinase